ncbi:MAG: putative LPS assembly protein LptD [Bacteroidia bacterium]|nr:putative LPS assembly protein LptD [Bacteroidia bacterium]MCX7764168.1 putative LPS assembly protein LptD [Bacteroidia bacterium]MDW8057657.1 putative LPS assembly protein LptD [Bacteroidia bacterium]
MQRWQILLTLVIGLSGSIYAQVERRPRQDTLPTSLRDSLTRASEEDTIRYAAEDSITFYIPYRKVYLYRRVTLQTSSMRLETGYARIEWEQGFLYGSGLRQGDSLIELPVFYMDNQKYEMDSLRYDLRRERGQVLGLKQQLSDEVLAGRTVQLNPDGTFYAADAYYTTCTAHPPHFYIASTRIKFYPEDRIVSGPLYMVVGEVPVPIFLPFGYFPLMDRRHSGIILPLIGQAADRGFFLRGLGYYWAINRYMDARLEADIFTRGGFRSELLWTYRKRYWYEGSLSIQYAYQTFNEPGDPDYQATRMVFVRWQHNQTLSPTASLSGSVQAGSSTFLGRQSYSATEFLSTNLQSSIALQKSFAPSPWQLTLGANHNQNIIQKAWSFQVPVIALYQNRVFPFERKKRIGSARWYERIGYTYRLDGQGVISLPESLLFTPAMWDTLRWGLRHNIQIAAGYTIFRYFQLTPTINYNEYLYSEQIRYEVDSAGRILSLRQRAPKAARDFSFNLTLATRLYGVKVLRGSRGIAFRHTLIPSVGYAWRPDFSEPQWKLYQRIEEGGKERRLNPLAWGFYGSPPSGRQQALQLSLNNLWEMRYKDPRDTTGRKYKYITLLDNVGASTSYNFAADSFHLAPIQLSARTNLLGTWLNLNYNATLDAYQYDSAGVRRPIYRWNKDRRIGTITQMNWALVTSIAPQRPSAPAGENEESLVFFTLPWRIDLSYNLVGIRQFFPDSAKYRWVQTLGASAEVNLTRFWRVQVSTGFDFIQKRLSFTTINIYRDLHCWELSFNWIPFGPRQSYFLTISARSPKLQDLRITKRRDWQDRFVRGL